MESAEANLRTDLEWELWGQREPYFGVLTDDRFRRERMDSGARSVFFRSGIEHVDKLLETCRQSFGGGLSPRRVLDFGCGVGRVLIPFARVVDEVVGVDVSRSMLAEARRNCDGEGLQNVLLVESDDTLSNIDGKFDLVHSSIVLQHVRPERGRVLFRALVGRVSPGGVGALHLTFADIKKVDSFGRPLPPPPEPLPPPRGSVRRLKDFVRAALGLHRPRREAQMLISSVDPVMEMHYYNFSELLVMLKLAGVQQFTAEMTDHGGALGAMILFRKPMI
jgi:SAM-dependent methyltransferase